MEGNPPQTPRETSRWSRDESNDEEIDRSKSPDEFGDTLRQNPFGNLISEDKMENSDGAKDEDDEPQTSGGKRKPPPSKVDVKERNRTHARNSRLRKKAHVEKLQRTALILSCKNEQMERQQVERMAATLDIQATQRAVRRPASPSSPPLAQSNWFDSPMPIGITDGAEVALLPRAGLYRAWVLAQNPRRRLYIYAPRDPIPLFQPGRDFAQRTSSLWSRRNNS